MKHGKVYLVGAGPGDPELLTLKALKTINIADAVVYDRLVSDEVMALVPHGVPRFFAGKSCKHKTMPQEEIHTLLITLARKGQHVVRLKGGDPFLFGRGGEEALALAAAQVPFEIVPGITSAQGCAAYAGIPLTHRGLATGVRFITGHRMAPEDAVGELELNWTALADPDTTLVVYMGLVNLETIASKLIEHGLPRITPVAAISCGTTKKQRVIQTTLETLYQTITQSKLTSPTLLVIGRVADISNVLQWFDQTPIETAISSPFAFTKMSY